MKKSIKLLLLAIGFAHNILFWNENWGFNLLIFSIILIAALFYMYPQPFQQKETRFVLLGTLVALFMVITFNTTISKVAYFGSFWVLIGCIHRPQWRYFQHHILFNFAHILSFPSMLKQLFSNPKTTDKYTLQLWYRFRIIIIPVALLLVFHLLFFYANERYANLSNTFFAYVANILGNFLELISIGRLFFTLLGICMGMIILIKTNSNQQLDEKDKTLFDRLFRKKTPRRGRVFDPMNALKKEYQMALVLLVLINLLLLVVNVIDINWVWFNFKVTEGMVLKHFVHEGTYLLILSILLSIGIILYYFRKNLHFFPGNKALVLLAQIWMAQNILLTVSVFLRNYHYIEYHGMAYKRMGVIVFLLLTLFGLFTMIRKIAGKHSTAFLLKQNTWAAYAMLIGLSTINWDVMMARFNLNHWHKSGIDVDFYFTLSPRVLPDVFANAETINEQIRACNIAGTNYTDYASSDVFWQMAKIRAKRYLSEQEKLSILSWNNADYQTAIKLKSYVNHE